MISKNIGIAFLLSPSGAAGSSGLLAELILRPAMAFTAKAAALKEKVHYNAAVALIIEIRATCVLLVITSSRASAR
jgi:hypothetical protein